MKFSSILKISIHNLLNNKLRTVLTLIVLFVMATVVMLMAAFGISFYNSADENIQLKFQTEDTEFVINNKVTVVKNETKFAENTSMSLADVERVLSKMDSADSMFSKISMTASIQGISIIKANGGVQKVSYAVPYYANSNPFLGEENYLYSGRMWTSADSNSNNVWMSSYFSSYYSIGEQISMSFDTTRKFTICGFLNYTQWAGNDYGSIFLDYHYFNGKKLSDTTDTTTQNMYIESIVGVMIPQEDLVYGMTTQNRFKDLSKDITTYSSSSNEGETGLSVTCELLDLLQTSNYILLGVLGVVIFLSLIIILLSIGSVANTIKITVEQNRKFFGMMKAIGMQDRTVKKIVQWQAIIMILISVILASVLVFFMIHLMESIILNLLTLMFGGSSIVVCSLSPIIPIVTFAALILAVLVFTRSSLDKLSKMDVISVISEVS